MNQVPVVHDDDDTIIGEDYNVGIMKAKSSIPVDIQTHIQSHSCRRHTTVNVSSPSIFLRIK